MTWQSLKRFCDLRHPEQKFRNDSQRKAFLVRNGVRLQKDEQGREGVVVTKSGEAAGEEKEIKVGKRLSAAKIRQLDYGDGSDFKKEDVSEAHDKNARGLQITANEEAGTEWAGAVWSVIWMARL